MRGHPAVGHLWPAPGQLHPHPGGWLHQKTQGALCGRCWCLTFDSLFLCHLPSNHHPHHGARCLRMTSTAPFPHPPPQFQNKFAAQRALLRNAEQMSEALIIGVKPLDARHRAAISQYDAMHGSPVQVGDQMGDTGCDSLVLPFLFKAAQCGWVMRGNWSCECLAGPMHASPARACRVCAAGLACWLPCMHGCVQMCML